MFFFFFNDTATTEIYTLSLHDALPIFPDCASVQIMRAPICVFPAPGGPWTGNTPPSRRGAMRIAAARRSEEHTSELQSRQYLVCRLLLEKKKNLWLGGLVGVGCAPNSL